MKTQNNKNQENATKNFKKFSEAFKSALALRGWTLEKFSELSGIPMGSLSNYSGGLNGPRAKNKERIKNLLALNEADFLPDDRRGGAPSGPEKVLIALSEGVARTAKELAGCYDLSEFVAYLVMREAEKRKTGALSAPVYTEKAILPDVSSKISSEGALDRGSHPEGRKSGTICD